MADGCEKISVESILKPASSNTSATHSQCGGERNPVKIIENEYIQLKDGVKLSARIWLPAAASRNYPVPAIFEFIPYRKRDYTATRDEMAYQHFGLHGYAGVRVDMRGSGDSTGLPDVKLNTRLVADDAVECIEWISEQPWCTGKVGMMGISFGGLTTVVTAARQPEALKAIIAIGFSDDRFKRHFFFKGGVMLMNAIKMTAIQELMDSLPPDPLISKDWLEQWLNRLNHLQPLAKSWMEHQTRDDCWINGSICENYSAIKAPSLFFSGHADSYKNAIKLAYDNIQCPKRMIIGPWGHHYPHLAVPKPLWGFCAEAVRWWDQWLKDSGSVEQKLVVLIQKNVEPLYQEQVEGRWVENPLSGVETFDFSEGKLGDVKGTTLIDICSSQFCGQQTLTYFPMILQDFPAEQTEDDKLSCIFDTAPFDKVVEYVGKPIVTLSVASDKPIASMFIRLCIVNEQGASRLIGYTGVNLNHSNNHETVSDMEPGVFKNVQVDLDIIGESIQPGQKLRLAISTSYFPMFVPNPEHTTLSLDLSKCQLDMPILLSSTPLTEDIPDLSSCKPHPTIVKKPPTFKRSIEVSDLRELTIHTSKTAGQREFSSHGLVTEWSTEEIEVISENNPNTARLTAEHKACLSRGDDWVTDIRCTMEFTMDKEYFKTYETREAKHNGTVVFSREYRNRVKRNGH